MNDDMYNAFPLVINTWGVFSVVLAGSAMFVNFLVIPRTSEDMCIPLKQIPKANMHFTLPPSISIVLEIDAEKIVRIYHSTVRHIDHITAVREIMISTIEINRCKNIGQVD